MGRRFSSAPVSYQSPEPRDKRSSQQNRDQTPMARRSGQASRKSLPARWALECSPTPRLSPVQRTLSLIRDHFCFCTRASGRQQGRLAVQSTPETRRAGATISLRPRPRVGQTADYGQRVIAIRAVWAPVRKGRPCLILATRCPSLFLCSGQRRSFAHRTAPIVAPGGRGQSFCWPFACRDFETRQKQPFC